MQKAETVLSILKQKSKQDESHRYDRIYRNLFNEDFFLRAYQKIHAKQGNMTPGTDGTTIDLDFIFFLEYTIFCLKMQSIKPTCSLF